MKTKRVACAVAVVGTLFGGLIAACNVNDVAPSDNVDSGKDSSVEAADATADVSSFADVTDAPLTEDVVQDAGLDVGSGFVSIAAWDHACAVMGDGRVACWGANEIGQASPSNDAGVLWQPEYVKGVTNAKQVSVTQRTSCALLNDGTVKCWGVMMNGPIPVQALTDADGGVLGGIAKVDVGATSGGYMGASNLIVMKTTTGVPLCLGVDQLGACSQGVAGTFTSATPMLSAPNTKFANVLDVASGEAGNSCLVASNGHVFCSGNGPRGDSVSGTVKLAAEAMVNSTTPFTGAVEVSSGYQHACAVQGSDRSIVNCWGANFVGQDGVPITQNYPIYVQANVNGISGKVVNISTGVQHTCVSIDDGTAQCWGWGLNGQLGNGTKQSSASAVTVVGLPQNKKVRHATAAGEYSCATMTDGTAYCWGKGDTGQLGDGQGKQSDTPVQVMAPK